ncbi:unnamed protein product, partial [Ectocarpus sp. 8 AP-2014]
MCGGGGGCTPTCSPGRGRCADCCCWRSGPRSHSYSCPESCACDCMMCVAIEQNVAVCVVPSDFCDPPTSSDLRMSAHAHHHLLDSACFPFLQALSPPPPLLKVFSFP